MFNVVNFDSRTLSWWYDQRKWIDFDPPYQRKGGVWSPEAKAYLIDSILNSFDMPKIYVADFTFGRNPLDRSGMKYAVVDGKQRFEAMFDFYEDKFPLAGDFIYEEDLDIDIKGMTFSEIRRAHPDIARKFENHNLSVMRIVTDEEGKINDLFIRLNSSRPLTGAELRAAAKGEAPKIIRSISEHSFFREKVRANSLRGQDKNSAAKLLLMEFVGKFTDTKKKKLDDLVLLSESDISGLSQAGGRVSHNLSRMNSVFVEKDPLLSTMGPLPLYYWIVKYLKDEHLKELRSFLLDFEAERLAHRNTVTEVSKDKHDEIKHVAAPNKPNADLYIFNTLTRSPDDKLSIEFRYNLLMHRFIDYLEGKGYSRDSLQDYRL